MREYLEFEKPIAEIEEKIEKLAAVGQSRPAVQDDLRKLRAKLYQLQAEIYARLTPGSARRSPGIRNGHLRSTTSAGFATASWNCTATACTATTKPSWRGSPA